MKMKKCNKCGEDKPLTAFHRRSKNPDGRLNKCKKCRLDELRLTPAELEASIQRRRERMTVSNNFAWGKPKTPEHREKLRQSRLSKKYDNELPDGVAAFNSLYGSYKRCARIKGRSFEIDRDSFRRLTRQPCRYCGAPPANMKRVSIKTGVYVYNGIDRIDNAGGYTFDNVVPCCEICNRAKLAMGVSEFIEWVNRVSLFTKNLKLSA